MPENLFRAGIVGGKKLRENRRRHYRLYRKPICEPKCPERRPGCHGTCPEFKKWRNGLDEDKEKRAKVIKIQKDIDLIRAANKER